MEIKFTKSQSLAIKEAIAARNAKLQHVNDEMQRLQQQAQEASVEYDATLLEVLGEHGVEKLPTQELEPLFFPQGSKRPDGIRWLDAPKAKAPAQGQNALDAAKAELGAKPDDPAKPAKKKGELVKLPAKVADDEAPPPKPLGAEEKQPEKVAATP